MAAYLVVLVHLAPLLTRLGVPYEHLGFGTVGVDLFFVISGFVMVHTTTVKPISATTFMANRIVRVVPLYWLITLVLFIMALIAPQLLGATDASSVDLLKSLLFIPYWKLPNVAQPVMFLGWTLNYEMFFYVLFALALCTVRAGWRPLLVSLVLAATVVALRFADQSNVLVYFYGSPMILEFAMGMWVAVAFDKGAATSKSMAIGAVTLGFLILIGQDFVYPDHRVILAGPAGAVILFGALSLEREGVILHNKIVQTLGAASYSLYLTHPFVTQAGSKLVERLPNFQGSIELVTFDVILLIAAGLVAVAVYHFVERPLVMYLRQRTTA